MKHRHRALVLILILLATVTTRCAFSGSLVDPFLEKFRVGEYRDIAAIALDEAWPADLWTPLVANTAPESSALDRFPRLAAATHGADSTQAGMDGFAVEVFALRATGDLASAAGRAGELMALAERNGTAAEYRFVWRLRAWQLGGRDASTHSQPWSYDAGLGPWDSRSAWILWCACRAAAGTGPVPDVSPSANLARHYAAVGRGTLAPSDIAGLHCPEAYCAGIGAAVVEDRGTLEEHFLTHATPPQNVSFQTMWLDGSRRLAGYTPDATRSLASLTGLDADLRLDLLRRASEGFVLRGRWEEGMEAFETAVASLEGQRVGPRRRRFVQWCGQLLALCAAKGLDDRRAQVFECLAGRPDAMTDDGDELSSAMDAETAQWRPGGVASAQTGVIRLDLAAARVRNGNAASFSARHAASVDAVAVSLADSMWAMWSRWGVGLASSSATAEAYAESLTALRGRALESGWAEAAAQAVDARLCESPFRDDIASIVALDPPAGFPALARRFRDAGGDGRLDAHAALGAALLLGDGRGVMSLTMILPQSVLSLDERLHFLYPLPPAGDLAAAIDGCGIEAPVVLAVARNESGFDPLTRSRAGALGWMQIMPLHYPENGFTGGTAVWRDPIVSLEMGSGLLRENEKRFGGDPYRTIAAYNAGGGAVDRWDGQLGGRAATAIFLSWIGYPETRRYVEKVLIDREIYDWILTSHARP